ncbi:MAG: carboxypeptidase regulatory-like domain-containing protein [Planctomycetes bacterium]|nr:carboxypeptidase regulatory-like domain-containing protein [Planctomycetota bacterium]
MPPADILRGRVIAAAGGAGIAGAEVRLGRCRVGDLQLPDARLARDVAELGVATTDADGCFAFHVARRAGLRLSVRAAGYPEHRVDGCSAGTAIVVTLQRGAGIAGVLRRAEDGAPVAEARIGVQLTAAVRGSESIAETVSATDGSFFLAGLPAAPALLRAEAAGRAPLRWQALDLRAGEVQQLELAMQPGRTVTGVVTLQGRPVADVEIATDWTFLGAVRTDHAGRYELRDIGGDESLVLRAAGHAGQRKVVPAGQSPRVDFELSRDGCVVGRLLPPAGYAAVDLLVIAAGLLRIPPHRVHTDLHTAEVAADGTFVVDGIGAAADYQLLVRGDGLGDRVLALPRRLSPGEWFDVGEIPMRPAASLAGRVVDAAGRPLAGVELVLAGTTDGFTDLLADPVAAPRPVYCFAERQARSGADGAFRFDDLARGSWQLSGGIAGDAHREEWGTFELGDGEARADLALTCRRGLPIAGVVRADCAVDLTQLYLVAVGEDRAAVGVAVRGDGRFEFPPLQAGAWRLFAADQPAGFDVVPQQVEAGDREVVLRLVPCAVIDGVVFDAAGPVAGVVVTFNFAGPQSARVAHTDAAGRFRLEAPPGLNGTLMAFDPADPAREVALPDVPSGARELLMRLP